jgi:hypothetical protein
MNPKTKIKTNEATIAWQKSVHDGNAEINQKENGT